MPAAVPEVFEKDDDANGHIDFITAASVCHPLRRHCRCSYLFLLFTSNYAGFVSDWRNSEGG